MFNPLVIFIAGPSGSGKTTLAKGLVDKWGQDQIAYISSDSYYKDHSEISFEEREKLNYDAPSAIDFKLMTEQIKELKDNKTIKMPQYDFGNHARSSKQLTQEPRPIIIVEGILILAIENLRQEANHSLYLDTQLDVCLMRRIRRDCMERQRTVESVLNQYEKTVHPMLIKYVLPSRQYASCLFEDGGPVPAAMSYLNEIIASKLELVS